MKVLKEKIMAVLPDECLICSEVFDKKAENAINTWRIIQEGQHIGLYCPLCWDHSKEVANLYLESEGSFIKS